MTKSCSVEGCGLKQKARGLCIHHYNISPEVRLRMKKYNKQHEVREKRMKYFMENKNYYKEYSKKWWREQKNRILIHYGGNPPKCACCGEDKIEFLSIDHINGGGRKHRKEIGKSGMPFYRWLIKNNFPNGYRVLCHNCNLSLGFYGYCPHNKIKTNRIVIE